MMVHAGDADATLAGAENTATPRALPSGQNSPRAPGGGEAHTRLFINGPGPGAFCLRVKKYTRMVC